MFFARMGQTRKHSQSDSVGTFEFPTPHSPLPNDQSDFPSPITPVTLDHSTAHFPCIVAEWGHIDIILAIRLTEETRQVLPPVKLVSHPFGDNACVNARTKG